MESKKDIFFEGRIYVGCDTNADDFAIKYLPTMNYTNHPVHGSHNFTDGMDVTGKYTIDVDDANGSIYPTDSLERFAVALPVKSDDKEAKEKARELVEKFDNLLIEDLGMYDTNLAKQCALICYSEMIKENQSILKMAELHMDERAVMVLKHRIFELEKEVDQIQSM